MLARESRRPEPTRSASLPAPHGFTHIATADGRVRISHHGRLVVTLAGAPAARLLARAAAAGEAELQLLLARATGNFARHNKPGGRG